MSDIPGNSGDQPVPQAVDAAGQPVAPQWATPPAQQWTPPAPAVDPNQGWAQPAPAPVAPAAQWTPPAPAVDPNQGWAQPAPAVDPNQPWAQQPAQFGGGFAPPPAKKSGGLGILWPIGCIVLLLALIATGAFAFMTNGTLNTTKDQLSSEQAARKSADAKVVSLQACVASMTTDEAALSKDLADLNTLAARAATGGDIDDARLAYEKSLALAEADYHSAAYDFSWATNQTQWDVAVALFNKAKGEMVDAVAAKTALDALVSEYNSAVDTLKSDVTTIQAQLATTATKCAVSSTPAPKTSAAPSASKKP
jgi:hypothetical protein